MMKSKNESKTAQRLLSSRKVLDVLPTLLRRAYAEHDSFAEGVQAVYKFYQMERNDNQVNK